ncbi:hypothetical protein A5320_17395 [Rheinheimera sp. SA_1]|nr:hypothetical protein A5320_17395 [Rheinheimera sp. SA_1]
MQLIPLNFAGSKVVTVKLPDIGIHELFVRTCNSIMCSSLSSITSVNVIQATTIYTVTAIAGSNGSISPTSINVQQGQTATFTVTPSSGFIIDSISGCGRTTSTSPFTTSAITAACTVTATFKALAAVAAPIFSPNGGTHSAPVSVTLATATSGAQIRYTIDGSDVTASSPLYSTPFMVTANTMVKAKSFKAGMADSFVTSADFVITASKVVIYRYDDLGRLTEVTDSINGNRIYGYDAAGNRIDVSVVNK